MESVGFLFDTESMTEDESILSWFTIVDNSIPVQDIVNIWNIDNNDKIYDLKKLGSGSFGDVFEYKSLINNQVYAIKTMDSWERKSDSRSQDARNLHKLQGVKCIPKLYAYIPNKLIIMEKIDGINVKNITDNDYERMSDDFYKVFCESMDEIKERGFFPHDLHTQNVMLNSDGLPVIVDVGHFKISKKDYKEQLWKIDDYKERYKDVFKDRNHYLEKKKKDLVAIG